MPNYVKIALVFVGMVVGAGFASGQELMQFFVQYGKNSIWGVVACGILFFLMCLTVLCKMEGTGARSAAAYFANLHKPQLVAVLHGMIQLFMLATFCVMVAASGAMFQEQLGISPWWGVGVMCLLCLGTFAAGAEGLVGINTVLTPLMIAGILGLGAWALFAPLPVSAPVTLWNNGGISSLLYASYNTLSLVVVMTGLSRWVDSRRTAVMAALLGGGVLLSMLLVLWGLLYAIPSGGAQLPVLFVAGQIHPVARWLYLPVLYFGIATTAVANGFGVIHHANTHPRMAALAMCLLAVLLSTVPFSALVARVYSLFGYLGMAVMVITIADGLKYIKTGGKERKTKNG